MAFGQSNGYPATRSQMEELTELVHAAGHSDFRDARGPLGLTQRQAAGKFTRDEADAFIAELQAEADSTEERADPSVPDPPARVRPARSSSSSALSRIPSETLAEELQHRGWIVVAP